MATFCSVSAPVCDFTNFIVPQGTIGVSVSISLIISIIIRLTRTIRILLAYSNFSASTEHLITSKQCVISPARIIPADHQLNPPQAPSAISLVTDYTRVVRFPHQPDPWQQRNHNFHLITQVCCSFTVERSRSTWVELCLYNNCTSMIWVWPAHSDIDWEDCKDVS